MYRGVLQAKLLLSVPELDPAILNPDRLRGGVAGGRGEAGALPIASSTFVKVLLRNTNFGPWWGVP